MLARGTTRANLRAPIVADDPRSSGELYAELKRQTAKQRDRKKRKAAAVSVLAGPA
jgi:hypothetical protein